MRKKKQKNNNKKEKKMKKKSRASTHFHPQKIILQENKQKMIAKRFPYNAATVN